MPETLLVDAHVHVFTRDMPLVDNPRHAPTYSFTVEQLIATMDAHGVQYAVIAAASPWGDYNDYTIAALRSHARLRGTVILAPTVERYILEAMRRDGAGGVRLPFIGGAARHHELRLPALPAPARRSRLARAPACGGRTAAGADRHHRGVGREAGDRPSRASRAGRRHQQRRLQGHAALDRARTHVGEAVRRLSARPRRRRLRARARPRRWAQSAGVGERLPFRRT